MAIEIVNKNRKPLRRKLFEDENLKLTKAPSLYIGTPDTKNDVQICGNDNPTSKHIARRSTPLSERQQIALLKQLTAVTESAQGESIKQGEERKQGACYTHCKRNERGETPLHLAAIKGDIEEVQKLLNQGVDINAQDFAGWTALHEACIRGWLNLAELLLQFGANVNASGLGKVTPLHDAAINGHHEVVNLLLKWGADPHQRNDKWEIPLDIAGSEEVASILKKEKASFPLENHVQQAEITSSRETLEEVTPYWQSETPPCHPTNNLCDLTMRKNSPQNQTQKGADKPTSPRLTLRFQSIRTRDDKNPTNAKVNDLSSNPTKYPSYCVTMEAKGDVYEFQKEDCHVSSSQNSVSLSESDLCSTKPNAVSKEGNNSDLEVKSTADSSETSDLPPQAEKMECVEAASAKINGGRLSGDSVSKDRDCTSDTEKEENRRKRRKSSDSVQSRHSSIGHSSSVKSHKSPSSKTAHTDGHSEQRCSPKGKKRGSLSSSDTESNPSDSEMPDIMIPDSLSSSNHNGAFATGLHSPKVPPLKIVIPSGSNSLELETRERSKVSSSKTALPYVVNTAESMDVGTTDVSANSFSSDGSKDGSRGMEATPTKSKEDTHPPEERFQRVTRSSQRMQAAMSNSTPTAGASSSDSSHSATVSSAGQKEHSGESSNEEQVPVPTDIHPRKRKLRTREAAGDCASNSILPPTLSSCGSSGNEDSVQQQQQQLQHHPPQQQQQQQQLLNSYQMYLNIRKQVVKRRKSMFIVHPKPPQGFKDYLLNRCSYVLAGNAASRLSVPMIPPPQSLEGSIKDLFVCQEKDRYRLRLQHLIEREKLVLSAEQEILRVHGRAARAMANQPVPLSVCSILKDEEIYNVLDVDQDDKDKNVRSRYNGRLFLSWLQDVDDKWEKIKEAMLLRHHNEAESLHAVQKLDWEWKMKELAMCDLKSTPVIDDISVPMVHVSDDFDLLPM